MAEFLTDQKNPDKKYPTDISDEIRKNRRSRQLQSAPSTGSLPAQTDMNTDLPGPSNHPSEIRMDLLTAGYDSHPVFENVSASIPAGSLTVILGRNGAGKSTWIKTMLGLIPSLSGSVCIDGKNLDDLPPRKRARKMAYVAQNRNIPAMQVRQLVLHGRFPYLSWPRRYSHEDLQIVDQAMQEMGIMHLAGRRLDELSGGERQKVYLAMALAQQADYIFFDEPASFMDLPSQQELSRLVKQLTRQGKGIVMIEHDLLHALEHADQILVLDENRLCFAGTPQQFLECSISEKVFHTRISSAVIQNKTRYFYD